MTQSQQGPLRTLFDSLKAGEIDRRTFVQRASMLGISAAGVAFLANTGLAGAQDASPSPEGGISEIELVSIRPDYGTENQERGAGGPLNIIQWQAATMLSPHTATGVKDFLGSVLVLEPLMHYTPDSTIVPNLVTEVPTADNGGLNADLTEVTLKLLPDVTWSDGEPFTADDVVFTIEWVQNPDNNAVDFNTFETIASAEAVDDLTVKVTFSAPNPVWFTPFTGTSTGFVYPKHILEAGDDAYTQFLSAPIGTGPYKVDSFTPNDQTTYSINENYREPNKPFFSTVSIKGGGDAPAAARAVIQTGEADFAWNLQVEPDILLDMQSEEAPGKLTPYPGITVERVNFNFSDPNTEVNGQRSEMNTPHPFLTDPAVRQAMNKAVDRQRIADEFYGFGQPPTPNILTGLELFESPNTSWEYNLEAAAQILEDAGWVMDGDRRVKDGVALELTYATSVNQVRQKTQAVVKDSFEQIGIAVRLEQIDAGIFFGGEAGNEQNINHMYWDISMYTNNPSSTIPTSFFTSWYAGPGGENIAQRSNGWQGQNFQRYNNPEFDALYDELVTMTDPEQAYQQLIAMNDVLINDVVIIPEVNRAADTYAISNNLRDENVAIGPFELNYWNIANWNRP